jgi:hypothetical protein
VESPGAIARLAVSKFEGQFDLHRRAVRPEIFNHNAVQGYADFVYAAKIPEAFESRPLCRLQFFAVRFPDDKIDGLIGIGE